MNDCVSLRCRFPFAWSLLVGCFCVASSWPLSAAEFVLVDLDRLSSFAFQEREGRWLKLISGVVILALGLVMIFKPSWLQLGQ